MFKVNIKTQEGQERRRERLGREIKNKGLKSRTGNPSAKAREGGEWARFKGLVGWTEMSCFLLP